MTEYENQRTQLLNYMAAGHSVTQRIASREFNCDRLGARIWELRRDGVPVKDAWEYKLDSNGKVVKKWKRYFMS